MKISREELLRLRKLVLNQLDWIDRKLEAFEAESEPVQDPEPDLPSPKAKSTVEDEDWEDTEAILAQYRSESSTSPRQLQFGCILLTAILSGLALFVFLGLPHLLKWGAQ